MEVLIHLIQKGSISRATNAVKNVIEDLQKKKQTYKKCEQISSRVEHSYSYSFDNDKQAIEIICNSYKNHPSILKIRSEMTVKENSINNTIFSPVNRDEVKQCLQKLNPRTAISQDKIPPALMKMAFEYTFVNSNKQQFQIQHFS